jgi:hypothetical protein
MSHKLEFSVKNCTNTTLVSYSVNHSWNDHKELLKGDDLGPNDYSKVIEITSGYGPEKDWWTISIQFPDRSEATDFYCNSSSSNKSVVLKVTEDGVDLCYYDKKGHKDFQSQCSDKAWR